VNRKNNPTHTAHQQTTKTRISRSPTQAGPHRTRTAFIVVIIMLNDNNIITQKYSFADKKPLLTLNTSSKTVVV
jgi:hypothetical protein